jgi:hypothetical protein
MIKKTFYTCGVFIVLSGNIQAYELATSIYFPRWDDKDPVMQETKPKAYAKNYSDPFFTNTMAKIFTQELDPNDKLKHDTFNKRILNAVLGFHYKAVEPGKTGFFAKVSGTATNFPLRASNMIDFIAIPIVEAQNMKLSLNDYTTKIRKEAIDNSTGREWAGGPKVIVAKQWINGISLFIAYPAKIEGVKYNSFASELTTILNEAHKYNLQDQVLEQIEKVSQMSHDDIEDAVKAFNKKNIGNSGLDHPVNMGYGYTISQKTALVKATEIQKNTGRGGKEFLESVINSEDGNAMPKKQNINPNTDLVALEKMGGKLSEVEAPELLGRGEMPIFRFSYFKMHLPALKQLYPDVWGSYE